MLFGPNSEIQKEDIREQVVRLQEQLRAHVANIAEFRTLCTQQILDLRTTMQSDLTSIKTTLNSMERTAIARDGGARIWERVMFSVLGTGLAFIGAVALWGWEHVVH